MKGRCNPEKGVIGSVISEQYSVIGLDSSLTLMSLRGANEEREEAISLWIIEILNLLG